MVWIASSVSFVRVWKFLSLFCFGGRVTYSWDEKLHEDLNDLSTQTSNSAFKDHNQSHESQSQKSLWFHGSESYHSAAAVDVDVLAEVAVRFHIKSQENLKKTYSPSWYSFKGGSQHKVVKLWKLWGRGNLLCPTSFLRTKHVHYHKTLTETLDFFKK